MSGEPGLRCASAARRLGKTVGGLECFRAGISGDTGESAGDRQGLDAGCQDLSYEFGYRPEALELVRGVVTQESKTAEKFPRMAQTNQAGRYCAGGKRDPRDSALPVQTKPGGR